MKQWMVAVLLLASASVGWAVEKRFPIAIRGTVGSDTGRVSVSDADWVTAPSNHLVLMIDTETNVLAIEEWNSTFTAKVDRDSILSGTQSLMENFRMAYVGGEKPQLMSNLEMVDMDWDRDGVEDTDGNMQLVAKLKMDKTTGEILQVTAQMIGVLNDPINGAGGVAKVFKGKLRTTGPAF
jgi:hypothetical protein